MLCKSLLVAALGILAQAGPIARRDAATVLTDLKSIYSYVSTLNTDVTAWNGDLLAALGILTDYNNVKSALDTAITDTVAASTFSTADSSSITSEVSTLAVLIVATLNEIIAKESTAASAGVASTLLSSVETLKTETDQLGADLEAKATSTDKTTIASAIATVDAAFASAIAAYE
ncbi:hydrophobic surface binding protein A [Aspergillus japonicus CBS 114.51]|uniref:Hydrophobic surface binding protein A n=2 Tax=Aspergillus TaxID=5052 RepID=A0A2V5IKU9_ASPV1|nr:hydrophobic surface binding protein A [Aspergillus japonicus CBS 114.51]PYI24507.1 hydrophobic surface binding protein A [Aspergillus violaceofuscus CBS 115571]RAH81684.1 hydrophobic surface binding protein A [Aspergillus japonicus CBS 114.51]